MPGPIFGRPGPHPNDYIPIKLCDPKRIDHYCATLDHYSGYIASQICAAVARLRIALNAEGWCTVTEYWVVGIPKTPEVDACVS